MWVLTGSWALGMAVLCAIKYRFYLYQDFDLALFAQAARGVLRGSFDSSIRGMPWLGDHSSLILIPLAPLTALASPALVLLTVQSVALALGAVALYRLARRELGSALAAVALACAWLLQPALGYVALFEFHPETLAVPALLWSWDALREGRSGRMLLAAGVALLCREDVAFAVLGIAIAALWIQRRARWRFAGALAIAALASMALSFGVLKPQLSHGIVDYGRLYAAWGPTTARAARAMLADPLRSLGALLSTPGDARDSALKLGLWFQLLAPWLLLPIAGVLGLLPALPILAEHLLSGRAEQHSIVYQYSALMLPFLAAGTVEALRTLAHARSAALRAVLPWMALLVLAAAAFGQWAFGPFATLAWPDMLERPQRVEPDGFDRAMRRDRDALVARVESRDGVVAGFETLARFADRAHVISAHHVIGGLYTFSDRPFPTPAGIHAALIDTGSPLVSDLVDPGSARRWRDMTRTNRLAPVAAHGDLTLWLRDAPDSIALIAPGRVPGTLEHPIRFENGLQWLDIAADTLRVTAGGELPITTSWQRDGALDGAIVLVLVLRHADGSMRLNTNRFLGYGLDPIADWPLGEPMHERYRWVIPTDMAPGRYSVWLLVAERTYDGEHPVRADTRDGPDGGFATGLQIEVFAAQR